MQRSRSGCCVTCVICVPCVCCAHACVTCTQKYPTTLRCVRCVARRIVVVRNTFPSLLSIKQQMSAKHNLSPCTAAAATNYQTMHVASQRWRHLSVFVTVTQQENKGITPTKTPATTLRKRRLEMTWPRDDLAATQYQAHEGWPVPHYRIAPPPEKSPPAENSPVKIRPARRPSGRAEFLPVNCRSGGLFWGGDPIMGRQTFMRPAIF